MSAALVDARFDLPPDPIAQAHAIAPILQAESPRMEALGQLTPIVVDALHAHGLYRALLPRQFNGYGAGLDTFVKVMEILAAADASTAWCVGQATGCSMAAAYVDANVAREIWGNDPRGVLAWGFLLEARAKVVPGGYKVTGKWGFGSGGHHATWMGAHCHVELPDGSLLKDADGALIERTMLLRQNQITWSSNWDVVGLRGTGSDNYTLNDVFWYSTGPYTLRREHPCRTPHRRTLLPLHHHERLRERLRRRLDGDRPPSWKTALFGGMGATWGRIFPPPTSTTWRWRPETWRPGRVTAVHWRSSTAPSGMWWRAGAAPAQRESLQPPNPDSGLLRTGSRVFSVADRPMDRLFRPPPKKRRFES